MDDIFYRDRISGKIMREKIYGARWMKIPYGSGISSFLLGRFIIHIAKLPVLSALFGWWQKRPATKKKILPFIEEFNIDATEFSDEVESFSSFNDFFIRKLKPESRPLSPGDDIAILPADARYTAYPQLDISEHFFIKGHQINLRNFLRDETLAKEYANGTMVIARLCPADYHHFHFPCDCIPGPSRLINGALYSVSPFALKKTPSLLSENKRMISILETREFGTILYIEVGATNVGSITQTFKCNSAVHKGEEKGYFSFGGSTIVLLFKQGKILFEDDLLKASEDHIELRGLMGQRLGKKNTCNYLSLSGE